LKAGRDRAKRNGGRMSAFDPKRTSAEISGGPHPNSQPGTLLDSRFHASRWGSVTAHVHDCDDGSSIVRIRPHVNLVVAARPPSQQSL
jgi:hypothetical protein